MKESRDNYHYVFPKWANKLPLIVTVSFVSFVLILIFVFHYYFSPKNLEVGYQPTQPIPFSHRLHAGELGMDCRYCHFTVEKAAFAAIPPTEVCMNCHSVVKADSEEIKKIKKSFETNKPIEWVKVHNLPDYVYFDHSRHVQSGVSCVTCHGRIDQMDVVRQVEPLSMSWCLDCHRNPAPNIRPKQFVTKLSWVPSGNAELLGSQLVKQYHIKPREDCNTCHR